MKACKGFLAVCPECSKTFDSYYGKWIEGRGGLCSECLKRAEPYPPLNARVEKALGKEITFSDGGLWYLKTGTHPNQWESISDYPNDIKLAMGAFWEYIEKHKLNAHINRFSNGVGNIYIADPRPVPQCAPNFFYTIKYGLNALDYCQAIVDHAGAK